MGKILRYTYSAEWKDFVSTNPVTKSQPQSATATPNILLVSKPECAICLEPLKDSQWSSLVGISLISAAFSHGSSPKRAEARHVHAVGPE
jgi:hypothetical protein